MSQREQLKHELVQHYRWLRQYGYNDSHSGNASFRWRDEVWLTPTGCCADTLTVNDLIYCHIDGTLEEGASLDARLHLQTYQKNDECRAVIHSHGAHAIAMTMSGEDFIPIDFEGQYYFPKVPVISINFDEYVDKSPEIIANLLKSNKVLVMAGHGVYACATSINLAYKWSCSLELSAKIAWLAKN